MRTRRKRGAERRSSKGRPLNARAADQSRPGRSVHRERANFTRLVLGCTSYGARPQARAVNLSLMILDEVKVCELAGWLAGWVGRTGWRTDKGGFHGSAESTVWQNRQDSAELPGSPRLVDRNRNFRCRFTAGVAACRRRF